MAKYRCEECYFVYDEDREGTKWEDLHDRWVCPVCESPKSMFVVIDDMAAGPVVDGTGKDDAAAETKTVSDCMVETMIHWGVKHIFGIVGHSNLGLADALRKQHEAGRLFFIGTRHEGAAYGKLTGQPAACLTIAGPGATNLLTGSWDAKMDGVPVLALTGQVDLQFLGPGSFQEVDLSAAFSAVAG